jgi:hypothetical protein
MKTLSAEILDIAAQVKSDPTAAFVALNDLAKRCEGFGYLPQGEAQRQPARHPGAHPARGTPE